MDGTKSFSTRKQREQDADLAATLALHGLCISVHQLKRSAVGVSQGQKERANRICVDAEGIWNVVRSAQ